MTKFHLKEAPIPDGETIREIRRDPRLCHTCFNLYGGSANTTVGMGRIWMHEAVGIANAARMALAEGIDTSEYPAWATNARADYTSWLVEADVKDILDSAKQGCTSCLLLREVLAKLCPQDLTLDDPALRLGIIFCKGSAVRLALDRLDEPEFIPDFYSPAMGPFKRIGEYELYGLPGKINKLTFRTQLRPSSGSRCPWPTIGTFLDFDWPGDCARVWNGGPARHIISDPSSQLLVKRIRSWIDTCQRTHSICSQAASSIERRLPKRVISVGATDVTDMHLLETDDLTHGAEEPYIALSHCWGTTRTLLSTKATVEQWKQKIPFGKLSNTFKDVAKLAQGLGVKYIWIDSICIIQDDKDDWQIEAAKMASIYEGAHIVVAATGSINGDIGFLNKRRPFITEPGVSPNGEPFEIYGRETIDHTVFGWGLKSSDVEDVLDPITGGRVVGDPSSYPLLYRAWCFQERVLATRIVHFLKDEMVFECLTCMECECGTLRNHEKNALAPSRRFLRTGDKYIRQLTDSNFRIEHYGARWAIAVDSPFFLHHELWRDLVVSYSSKQITRRTDCLPAMAGLAVKWSGQLSGRYLAGLWEKDLLNGLRWQPFEKESEDRLADYTAPSWSWASLHRGVSWGLQSFERDEFFVEVDNARTDCPPNGLNPFGEVSCGYIFLTGCIMALRCSLREPGERARLGTGDLDTEEHTFQPDNGYELERLGLSEVICLRLCSKMHTMNAYDDDCALVLRKPDLPILLRQPDHVQRHEHVYQRVGYLHIYSTKAWQHEQNSKEVGMYLI